MAQKNFKSKIFLVIINLLRFLIPVLIFGFNCQNIDIEKTISMNWTEFDIDLPKGIIVYQGQNKQIPLKAWVAKIDLKEKNIAGRNQKFFFTRENGLSLYTTRVIAYHSEIFKNYL